MICNFKKLEELRKEKKITLEKLAKDEGMDYTAFCKQIQEGGTGITLKEAVRIKDAMNMTNEEAVKFFFLKSLKYEINCNAGANI
ncbi:MAG: helix-turn-helix domain-containing protein [Lachnospiraceae bacterium]